MTLTEHVPCAAGVTRSGLSTDVDEYQSMFQKSMHKILKFKIRFHRNKERGRLAGGGGAQLVPIGIPMT